MPGLKAVEFVGDMLSYIGLIIIFLNAHAANGDKSDVSWDKFYEEICGYPISFLRITRKFY
jgi:hypothetical protein